MTDYYVLQVNDGVKWQFIGVYMTLADNLRDTTMGYEVAFRPSATDKFPSYKIAYGTAIALAHSIGQYVRVIGVSHAEVAYGDPVYCEEVEVRVPKTQIVRGP